MKRAKNKPFHNLTPTQKRRRLQNVLCMRSIAANTSHNVDVSDSSTENETLQSQSNESQATPLNRSENEIRCNDASSNSDEPEFLDNEIEETETSEEEISDENEELSNQSVDLSTSSEEDELPLENLNIIRKRALKNAFLAANLKHTQCNILLNTLREFPFNLNFLPKDARSILQTPTNVAGDFIRQIAGGEYLHIGLKITVEKKLKSIPANSLPENILMDFSTDGGKLNKGSKHFWPIQYRILNIGDKRPIIAGIFFGDHKPATAFEFFEQFLAEVIDVRENGIAIGDKLIFSTIHCFIADAPARAFASNHAGHNGHNPCSKCKVEGRYYMNTMIFEGIEHQPRTDEEYRNMVDEDHHHGRSPLSELLGLVTRVPFEGLHSIWSGNVKKVLSAIIGGHFGVRKLNGRKQEILDSRMNQLQAYTPSDFNRRPNKLTAYVSFKATEFRQLGLYTAPSVFKNVLEDDQYEHFLLLDVVLRFLVDKETPREILLFCKRALEVYVSSCADIYDPRFLSYNVHCLLHIIDDILELGSLESYSAFCYENNMPEFRKLIRKPGLPLQQYYKRIQELNDFSFKPLENNRKIVLSLPHGEGPIPEDIAENQCQQFRKLKIQELILSNNVRDSCCILNDTRIGEVKNILLVGDEIILIFQAFQIKEIVYDVGVTSDNVGVYHTKFLSDTIKTIRLSDVKKKCCKMPYWSHREGREELALENEWICCTLLSQKEMLSSN